MGIKKTGEFGNRFGTPMLGKFTRKDEADRYLDFS
jgi:hypothetical protein